MQRVKETTGITEVENILISFKDWKSSGEILKKILNDLRRDYEG